MRKLYTILLLIFSPALFAQTNFGGLDSSQTVPKVIIEAKVMPETLKSGETGRVFVTFTFEKGFHQTKNEDFFLLLRIILNLMISSPWDLWNILQAHGKRGLKTITVV